MSFIYGHPGYATGVLLAMTRGLTLGCRSIYHTGTEEKLPHDQLYGYKAYATESIVARHCGLWRLCDKWLSAPKMSRLGVSRSLVAGFSA
jgi:hypothetical protein